ncbi:hypothetical protein [Sphingobacterium sp. HMA12]|uniref:hypothetical protein n=1 Tax=Sphingobacterium sp. HMA12 TaxID=2050894 RepID=UPI0013152672|nr:hypothetical protein [Sphingobacterium sp. HMA12]
MPLTFGYDPHMLRTNFGTASGLLRYLVGSASVIHRQQGKQQSKNSQTNPNAVPKQ